MGIVGIGCERSFGITLFLGLSNRKHMMPTAHIHSALGERRRGHQHFTHVVGCHQPELRACLDYENLAVFTGHEYHAVRRYGRSAEPAAGVLDAPAVFLFPALDVVTSEDAVILARVEQPESDRLVETPADSFFELIFDAEEGEPFRLKGQVDALAFAAEAFASVELVRLADDAIVAEHAAFGGEYDRFDDTGTLAAGRYRLTAFALSYGEVGGGLVGGGDVGGDISSPAALASFRAVFLVPEPLPGTGAAVALLVLVRLAKARRRSS